MPAEPTKCPNEGRIGLLERQVDLLVSQIALLLNQQDSARRSTHESRPPRGAASISAQQASAARAIREQNEARVEEQRRNAVVAKELKREERAKRKAAKLETERIENERKLLEDDQRRVEESEIPLRVFLKELTIGKKKSATWKAVHKDFMNKTGQKIAQNRFHVIWGEVVPENWKQPKIGR